MAPVAVPLADGIFPSVSGCRALQFKLPPPPKIAAPLPQVMPLILAASPVLAGGLLVEGGLAQLVATFGEDGS